MIKNQISNIQKEQKKIAAAVTKKFPQYYLTGGTALAFHFHHRFSEDLDFFSQSYDPKTPDEVMEYVKNLTGFSYKFKAEIKKKGLVQMKVYVMNLPKNYELKIDFVQDYLPNVRGLEKGMHSIEDIYYRKCSIGLRPSNRQDELGRELIAGRQMAKDIFDLYYLSKHYKKLSEFCFEHFTEQELERFCAWYRRFNRLDLKIGLQELATHEDVSEVIPHLDKEILRTIAYKVMR